MNRNNEFDALQSELETTPQKLEDTVQRALARKSTSRKKQLIFGVPAGSLAVCFAAFILLVNLFPTFAHACGNVPVLRELATAVARSASLSAAVEDEYVQPMDLEQTANGITARVEYVIVDRKQVNIFYTLNTDAYGLLDADATVGGVNGMKLDGFSSSSGSYGTPNGELRQLDADFMDGDMPDALDLTLRIYESGWNERDMAEPPVKTSREESLEEGYFTEHTHAPDYLAEFTFPLEFDPYFTAQGEIVPVDRTFEIDGQTLTLEQAEIYPTHLRLDFGYSPDNTAWLKGLEFYVENERGQRFEPITNGITASGEEHSPSMVTYWMDSPYFSDSEVLTLHITQARWLEKDREKIWLNLETGAHDPLPNGAELVQIEKLSRGYLLTFRVPTYREGMSYNIWLNYYDSAGKEGSFLSYGADTSWRSEEPGEWEDAGEAGYFYTTMPLTGYQEGEVWLAPTFTRIADFTDPVTVPIK